MHPTLSPHCPLLEDLEAENLTAISLQYVKYTTWLLHTHKTKTKPKPKLNLKPTPLMLPVTILALPVWAPTDCASLLKEEYQVVMCLDF